MSARTDDGLAENADGTGRFEEQTTPGSVENRELFPDPLDRVPGVWRRATVALDHGE